MHNHFTKKTRAWVAGDPIASTKRNFDITNLCLQHNDYKTPGDEEESYHIRTLI